MPWKRGESGNPGGWSSAQRRLYKGFLTDVQKRWREKGGECLDRMIRDHPEDFVKTVVALMPKSLLAEVTTKESTPVVSLPDTIHELQVLGKRLGFEIKLQPLPHYRTEIAERVDDKSHAVAKLKKVAQG